MEDLIGLLVFLVIAIFGAAARYKESQRAKKDMAPPPPPKPRPALPKKTERQFERRDIRTARPAQVPAEPRPRPVPPRPRPAPRAQVTPPPRPAPMRPLPVFAEEEDQRLRPGTVRAPAAPAALAQQVATPTVELRGGRQAAREALQQAVGQETEAGPKASPVTRQRRVAMLPPLLRSMEGIRSGIIFSEIIGPPLALR